MKGISLAAMAAIIGATATGGVAPSGRHYNVRLPRRRPLPPSFLGYRRRPLPPSFLGYRRGRGCVEKYPGQFDAYLIGAHCEEGRKLRERAR